MIKLFSPQSGTGRTIRGYLQAFVGLTAFFTLVVTDPNFAKIFASSNELLLLNSANSIAIVTALHNGAEWILNQWFSTKAQD